MSLYISSIKCVYTSCVERRWSTCESAYHKMFINEIKDSSVLFKADSSFIPALLSLKTSHLLSDENATEKKIADLMELRSDLGQFLTAFIQKHNLAGVHTARWFLDSVVCSDCVNSSILSSVCIYMSCNVFTLWRESCLNVLHPLCMSITQRERNIFTPLQQVVLSTVAKVRMH